MPQSPALIAFVWADSDPFIEEAFESLCRRPRREPSQVTAFIAARGPQPSTPTRQDVSR